METPTEVTVAPALTPEEWAEMDKRGVASVVGDKVLVDVHEYDAAWAEVEANGRHALAALALHNQRFGFTREDVEAVRESAEDDHAAYTHHARLRSIADRIAALLPPE